MGFLPHRNGNLLSETLVVLALALAMVVFAAGCAGGTTSSAEPANEADQQSGGAENEADRPDRRDSETSGEATTGEDRQVVAGDATVGPDGTVVAGDVTIGPDGEVSGEGVESDRREGASGGTASEATLEMKGDAGTTFSGTCLLGEEEMDVSGEVPASFSLPLDGRKLDCEILKEGEGRLTLALEAGGSQSVSQVTSPNATVNLTYSGDGGVSVSSSSSSSSGSVRQDSSSSVVQQNSSIVQQQSSSSNGSR